MDLSDFVPVILTVHALIVLALIGVVLLQRSEGGALGMGGGGGGIMSGRGAANALTRLTSILAALFFTTSLGLAIIADQGESDAQIIEDFTGVNPNANPDGEVDADSLIRSIGGSLGSEPVEEPSEPDTPAVQEPQTPATDDPDTGAVDPATDGATDTPADGPAEQSEPPADQENPPL